MTSPAAADALLHYLSQARLASPAAAAQLCVDATEDANLYVFSELLAQRSIQSLAWDQTYAKYVQLLRLFAYGTLEQYQRTQHMYPRLSERQLNKLRTLTLVSLAAGRSELSYHQLRHALAVHSTRQLEDVVIDAVYAGLLRARMNQHAATVHISAVEGRDVHVVHGIEPMVRCLNNFLERCARLDDTIDDKMQLIATHTMRAKQHKLRADAQLDAVRSAVRAADANNSNSNNNNNNNNNSNNHSNNNSNSNRADARQLRLRNKSSADKEEHQQVRHDTRAMRARRARSSDSDACE
ncbi:unnamed protein product [Agarophyton chilense]